MDTLKESQPSLPQTTRDAFQEVKEVKEVTQQSVLVPLAQGALDAVETIESSGQALAEATDRKFTRVEAWAERHPTGTLGVAFGIGMLAGILFFRR